MAVTMDKAMMWYLKVSNGLVEEEEGQGLVEYALIISLVAIVLVVSLGKLEGGIASAFTTITGSL